MADKLIRHKIVEGCHDCPMLENLGFGMIRCEYIEFPLEIFIDPLDIKPPPTGCPLLLGSIVITLEDPPTVGEDR